MCIVCIKYKIRYKDFKKKKRELDNSNYKDSMVRATESSELIFLHNRNKSKTKQ
jgi:hypothetical protein